MKYITTVKERQFVIEIDQENDRVLVDGVALRVDLQPLSEGGLLSLLLDNRSIEAVVEGHGDDWDVLIRGELYSVQVENELLHQLNRLRSDAGGAQGMVRVESPMPGIIVKTPVAAGDAVTKGMTVVILESMKMENELKTPRDGVVKRVVVAEGDSVEKGQELIVIGDPEPGGGDVPA